MNAALETNGLVKSFHGMNAVDGLDWQVAQGSIYGFLGQNGAGKTTTLRMLTNLARPTTGEIRICGQQVMFGSGRTNLSIGYLPDVPQFYDWMLPKEYLELCGRLQGMSAIDAAARAKELLGMVGLEDNRRRIKGYSRGMKQRLGIAQALMHNPKLLLLDEPTSALDPIGRKEVLDIIASLAGKLTVVFSTHILSDVERICDHIGMLHHGKLVLDGSLTEISQRYAGKGALLEVDAADSPAVLHALHSAGWAQVEEATPGQLRLKAASLQELDARLCPLLAELNVPVRRYEHTESTLEDVFVEVIGA